MVLGIVLILTIVAVGLIWIMLGVKSHQHKGIAILLILLILFATLGFNSVFKDKDVKIENIEDLGNAVKIYFNWFGYIFNNVKVLTANVVEMNWAGNETA